MILIMTYLKLLITTLFTLGLTRARMTSLYNRRLQDIVILMYKVKFQLIAANTIDLFSVSLSSHNLRNSDFFIPRLRLEINAVKHGKHSIRYIGPFLWSKLSKKGRDLTTLSAFKTSIRKKDLSSLIAEKRYSNCNFCNT